MTMLTLTTEPVPQTAAKGDYGPIDHVRLGVRQDVKHGADQKDQRVHEGVGTGGCQFSHGSMMRLFMAEGQE
jgi:hypothetical protein